MTPARKEGEWTTTVDELVGHFRDALLALIPVFEQAHLPWREGEAYDQWDDVAAVLYDRLVREPLNWALADGDDLALSDYDLVLPTWSDRSFIAVRHPQVSRDSAAVFLRLESRLESLDTVAIGVLDEGGTIGSQTTSLPFVDVSFVLVHRSQGLNEAVSSLSVPE